ncbi:hypothetical protein BH24PSE2_BH24PSE2_24660 [soil metagenome]
MDQTVPIPVFTVVLALIPGAVSAVSAEVPRIGDLPSCGQEPRDEQGQLVPFKQRWIFPAPIEDARCFARVNTRFDIDMTGQVVNVRVLESDLPDELLAPIYGHLYDLEFRPCRLGNQEISFLNEQRIYDFCFAEGPYMRHLGIDFAVLEGLPKAMQQLIIAARASPPGGFLSSWLLTCTYDGKQYFKADTNPMHGDATVYDEEGIEICRFHYGEPIERSRVCVREFLESADCDFIWRHPHLKLWAG